MITIKNLYYKFDKRFCALYDINFNINDNEIVLLKSTSELESQTIFRILSKQYKDYTGDVFFDNKNLNIIQPKDLSISYITKCPYLLKHKSILYNIAYPLIIRKIKKTDAILQAKSLLEKYNLHELLNKKVKQISYNEKILICVLRGIVKNPKYIFVEDIFSKLTPKESKFITEIINQNSVNKTIIVACDNEDIIKLIPYVKILDFENGSIK